MPIPPFVTDAGIWVDAPRVRRCRPVAALFLDRDGVIVEDVGFLGRPQDVRMIPAAGALIAAANRAGIPVVVVTNQSGIGRRLFDWTAFAAVEAEIAARLARDHARRDAVLACPFHPEAAPPFADPDHPCRKPNPGLLRLAAEQMAIDLSASWIIGDRASDIAAGKAAGLQGGILVGTDDGHGPAERAAAAATGSAPVPFTVITVRSVAAARRHLPLVDGSGGE